MPRLIWVFTGCTDHFVGFVVRQLIFIKDATSTHKDTQKCNRGLKNEERDQATNSHRKSPKYSDTQNIAVIILKFEQCGSTTKLGVQKNADRMANSVDPDQTAPLGAVWSGTTLIAQTYLS